MPTISYYPAAYAAEAARNLRALAATGNLHATGPLIAELRDAATAMRQVLDQLATARTLPGDPAATAAADELHQAGTALDETATRLTSATQTTEPAKTQDRFSGTSPVSPATETAEPVPHGLPTRRSRREQARRARAPEPEGSWFAPPAASTRTARGRGLSL